MKRELVIRRAAVLAVAVLLLVIALILPRTERSVAFGAGNGTNAKVSNIEEVSDLFEALSKQMGKDNFAVNTVATTAAQKKAKYESMTMQERSAYSVKVKANGNGLKMSVSASAQRELDIYVTPEVTYYSSAITMYSASSASMDGEKESSHAYVSVRIGICIEDDRKLLKIDEYTMIDDGKAHMGMERVLGKWVDLADSDDEAAQILLEELMSVNDGNFETFAVIDRYITENCDDFRKTGDEYKMSDSLFSSFMRDILAVSDASSYLSAEPKGEFIIDLNSAARPVITIAVSDSDDYEEGSAYASASVSEEDVLEFSNINNTVVKLPDKLATISFDEFAEAMEESFEEE